MINFNSKSGLFNIPSNNQSNRSIFIKFLAIFFDRFKEVKEPNKTPIKSAEEANVHEALNYLAYSNARIHAQNEKKPT